MLRLLTISALVFVAAAAALQLALPEDGGRRHPAPVPPPTAAAAALLGGIEIGDAVADAHVIAIHGPTHDVVAVDLRCHGGAFTVSIEPLGPTKQTVPQTTRDHVIYYGSPIPANATIAETTYRDATTEIARRVREHEASTAP